MSLIIRRMMTMSLFEKIAQDLSNKIIKGDYSSGSVLPNEGELQKTYGASRTTIRKAIDILVTNKQVTRRKGVGLFVAPEISTQNILEMTGIMKPDSLSQGKQIFKEHYLRKAGNYYSQILNIKTDELIYYINFIQFNSASITKETLILPLKNFPELSLSSLKILTVLEMMNLGKEKVVDLEQELQLIVADKENAKQLNVRENDPIFKIVNRALNAKGLPIALELRYDNALQTKYVVDF